MIPMSKSDARPTEMLDALRTALHDLNNALTPVMANAQLARLMIDPSNEELGDTLDDMVEASARANLLVSRMREIAKDLQRTLAGPTPTDDVPGGPHHG